MKDLWQCPNCKTEWERTEHYKAILRTQNMIALLMGNPKIIEDMCGKCNYMAEQEENK